MSNEENIKKLNESSYQKAIKKLSGAKDENSRFCILGSLAIACLNVGKIEDAKKYADELNESMSNHQNSWNYGNAVQDINVVLGRIAIINDQIEDAKKHLIEAGKSKGSPQMLSFGPNMSLAKELLEKGEQDVVLEYFELCRKFWENDRGNLDKWSQEVKDNIIPDFGGNLYY